VNAAASDGKWHNATGWEIYTSPGKTKADDLATCLFEAARYNLKD
jgi:N-acetylmuramoyl-L-alanine amidase